MTLQWDDSGWGFLPPSGPTRTDFFDEYREKDQTDMGQALIRMRLGLLRQYVADGELVIDVGIGGGGFVCSRGKTLGLDVDPKAIEWLRQADWLATKSSLPSALCFWDSFEHMPDHELITRYQPNFVLMSIPLFSDKGDVLTSKHYKPGEHLWYFTHRGLLTYMERLGYEQMHFSRAEEILGREGIGTLVFARRDDADRMRCPQI